MRILLFAIALACFGTASAQTPLAAGRQAAPTVKTAPLAAKPPADLLAAKQKELAEIDAQLAPLQREKDSLGSLGAEKQMRLQAMTERRSKVAQQISEMMKKTSDTQSSIVQNIK